MGDDNKDNEARAETNIKKWIGEVLDERDTKAAAAATAQADKDKEEAEKNRPIPWFERFFGG